MTETLRPPSALELAGRHRRGESIVATVREALERAESPAARHAFISLRREQALADAAALQQRAAAGGDLPLLGVPLSVKDLFDCEGERTTAGSRVLADAPPASADAPAVARLKAAGAIVIGRTNMTEFAFSGLGLNPHYGTPHNPADRHTARIPGGSSSGAAVSVAVGAAAIGLGSDTGGSLRIPAAFCGLVGFKPTQHTVPVDGTVPLSPSLDTAGAISASVADAAAIHAVLSATPLAIAPPAPQTLRFLVPTNLLCDALDATVQAAFARALGRLRAAGCRVEHRPLPPLDELAELYAHGSLPNAEAFAWHEPLIERGADGYDPRVLNRILRGKAMTAAQYIRLVWARRPWIARMTAALQGADALLCPTVATVAPPIDAFETDAAYGRINALVLRNTSVVNFWDGCSISLPCHDPARGELPVGLMLSAPGGADARLLGVAAAVETIIAARA
jgi:Asp-tRNA(Asn)/Glu-tRNA(Gln) amidotransferase A subunit family amidase